MNLADAQDVQIPDPHLAAAVLKALGLPLGTPIITKQVMQRLTELDTTESRIEDLTGLEHATNLENLDLGYNEIKDVSPLSGLKNLEQLSLTYNEIVDILPLSELTNLKRLDLSVIGLTQY